jgi:hypothetical protein
VITFPDHVGGDALGLAFEVRDDAMAHGGVATCLISEADVISAVQRRTFGRVITGRWGDALRERTG